MLESTAQCNAALNARATAYNSGQLCPYTGTRPSDLVLTGTKLGTLTFGSTAFAAAANGQMDANSITQDSSADASGTIGYVACLASNGTTVISTHTVGVGSGEAQFNTLSVSAGQPISCTLFRLTQPAGTGG